MNTINHCLFFLTMAVLRININCISLERLPNISVVRSENTLEGEKKPKKTWLKLLPLNCNPKCCPGTVQRKSLWALPHNCCDLLHTAYNRRYTNMGVLWLTAKRCLHDAVDSSCCCFYPASGCAKFKWMFCIHFIYCCMSLSITYLCICISYSSWDLCSHWYLSSVHWFKSKF